MTEHKFKVGDKVEYIGDNFLRSGETFTIIGFTSLNQARLEETSGFTPYVRNLKLVEPAKDYIQIDRALLPEVTEGFGNTLVVEGDNYLFSTSEKPMIFALRYLAMAEHLKVKEAKANELDERRNSVLKEHGFINNYNAVGQPAQSLVNALLAKEDSK